ncbi:MAG: AraC family transcriptional regulator [Hydrogenophilaceae bacterium]|nr:AraC family transcriptional regulator [Hydrogenophilaceae bacterium]
MLLQQGACGDVSWTSQGAPPLEALARWRSLAREMLAPTLEFVVPEPEGFSAHWRSFTVGPARLVTLEASPLTAIHPGAGAGEPMFQLFYCRRTPILTRVGAKRFCVNVGEFVLVDNAKPLEMRLDDVHDAIDLVMPGAWLRRWLPDPLAFVDRPFSATSRWGAPLAALLSAMAADLEDAALPRSVLADQAGGLLALAAGRDQPVVSRHKSALIQRALFVIEERQHDPELHPRDVAGALGISKRYLHALLAEAGTTFVGALTRVRLERASQMLTDPRMARLQIAEIALQCGYLDPSYFARAFRRRFGMGPRDWRRVRLTGSA